LGQKILTGEERKRWKMEKKNEERGRKREKGR
jgi:hypothetical protein